MVNSWFRWERQASLHLLFPTLEVFFTSLQKYSGVKSPTMVLIFKKGIVTWCINENEFIDYGNKLLQVYSDPFKERTMVDDVRKRLNILATVIPAKAGIQKTESAWIPDHVGNDNDSERLIELLKHYAKYKDNRKKEILVYLHYVDSILMEVARRTKLSIDEVRMSTPQELADILTGQQLGERLKYFCIVWEKDADKPLLLTGTEGKRWEQKTFSAVIPSKDGIHITGRSACPGKVIGKVRVLLKAQDCDQMKDGEVLVTFMTSPDFMKALRKASAIVTNLGGVTSHAAIISRELNIPCIVGTKIATQVLKTGDKVEVDANKGIIRKLI